MEVMLIKDKKINEKISISKGQVFKVRKIEKTNMFGGSLTQYQIIDIKCPFSGEFLSVEYCIEQSNGQPVYTENEWNDMENYYMKQLDKEREKKGRAQELVKELTKSLNRKNALLQISAMTIEAALGRIKELEKV